MGPCILGSLGGPLLSPGKQVLSPVPSLLPSSFQMQHSTLQNHGAAQGFHGDLYGTFIIISLYYFLPTPKALLLTQATCLSLPLSTTITVLAAQASD